MLCEGHPSHTGAIIFFGTGVSNLQKVKLPPPYFDNSNLIKPLHILPQYRIKLYWNQSFKLKKTHYLWLSCDFLHVGHCITPLLFFSKIYDPSIFGTLSNSKENDSPLIIMLIFMYLQYPYLPLLLDFHQVSQHVSTPANLLSRLKQHVKYDILKVRGDFKTQPAQGGCHCLEQ